MDGMCKNNEDKTGVNNDPLGQTTLPAAEFWSFVPDVHMI